VLEITQTTAQAPFPAPQQINDFEVRLADSAAELDAAQALRYDIFYGDMGATPSAETYARKRDIDGFDDICDHLLVIDRARSNGTPHIAGTYRLLRRSVAEYHGGFYSASEFDLSALDYFSGEILELGRSCVAPDYRGRAVMQILWRGIADYVSQHGIGLMFGCASFPGTDPAMFAPALSFLHGECLAPEEWRPRALDERYVDMDMVPCENLDVRRTLASMPPLLKGYLRLGGVVGDGAVIDYQFGTTDVCLLVETEKVTEKYLKHYTPEQIAN
jgi:putative hemolysin